MMSEEPDDVARRMHPISVLFRVGALLRQLAIPLILFLIFARGETMELYASILMVPLAIFEIWRYITTTYRISNETLIVKQGVLFRSERHIPLARVQNIDLVQNFFHRLLSVAEVRVETASGSEPEAILKVLKLDEVERIRREVFSNRRRAPDERLRERAAPDLEPEEIPQERAPEAVELLHLSLADLIKLGIITYRGLAIVGVAFGVAWQMRVFDRLEDKIDQLDALFLDVQGANLVLLVAGSIVAAFLLITLLSVLWAVVTLYDYRLLRIGEDLRVTCGLWTRLTATIPRERIQLVSVRQSLLHRLFDCVSISIETAGGSGESDKIPVNRRWLVPLVHQSQVERMLREIQPAIELVNLDWQAVSPRARRRLVRRAMLLSLLLSVPLALLSTLSALVGFPILLLLLCWHAWAQASWMRFARTESGIAFRSGVFVRRTSGTRIDRIQNIAQRQTPFDRRYAMATVSVDTAGAGPAGHKIEIPYLDTAVAASVRSTLVADTARTDFRWA